jgi:hypothetical protein
MQPLGPAAGRVDVGLGVGVHDLDLDAEPLPDEIGGDVGLLLARLPDQRLQPRAGAARHRS